MISPFDEALAASSAAIDVAMGERLRIEPQKAAGEFTPPGPDPSRPVLEEVIGVVTFRSGTMRRAGAGARTQSSVELAEPGWRVSLDEALAPGIRAGDRLVRLDKPGSPTFRLLAPVQVAGRAVHPMVPA